MAKKHHEVIQGTEKEFLNLFQQLCYSRSAWQVWADLITAIACSLSNAIDRSPEHFEQREKEYSQCIERLGSVDVPAKILGIIVMALENEAEQDFLGKMYMNLNLGNHWKGQFFTPYSICKMMSQITVGNLDRQIEEQGYISVCDPACGAGATLIAAANTMKSTKYNFQNHVLFVGQDIDRVTGMMCYIQLSLLGCAGYICIGNTLTNPLTGPVLFPQEREEQELWYMPMFQSDIWSMRRMLRAIGSLGGTETTQKTVEKEHFFMFFDFEEKENPMENKDFNENEVTKQNKNSYAEVDTETGIDKVDETKPVKLRAKEKLKKELKIATNRTFAEPIINYLLKRCEEDEGMAEDVVQEHKTWNKCFNYIYNHARKQEKGNCAYISDDVVYEWAEDYYHKDDKVEEEEKARKAAEEKSKQEKAVKTSAKASSNNDKANTPVKKEKTKEQPKKISNGMEGQLDMFSMMGM